MTNSISNSFAASARTSVFMCLSNERQAVAKPKDSRDLTGKPPTRYESKGAVALLTHLVMKPDIQTGLTKAVEIGVDKLETCRMVSPSKSSAFETDYLACHIDFRLMRQKCSEPIMAPISRLFRFALNRQRHRLQRLGSGVWAGLHHAIVSFKKFRALVNGEAIE
jgi:hypothetical protein